MSILHFGEHHKDALQGNLLDFTEQHGSKGGILEFLRTFPDLREHILPGFSINHETLATGSIPDLPAAFRDIEKSLIYRSSHPDDHRGYIGMLPTLLSRHHAEENQLSAYKLSVHDRNLARVYNALSYYQKFKEELRNPGYVPPQNQDYYNLHGYPLSDPGQSYESREDFPGEYAEFIDIDQYGYHLDYLRLYTALLEKVKNGEDTTDYSEVAQSITHYKGWSHREMIKRARESISNTIGYKEGVGLRGTEKTGIYIQPEITPDGGVMGGIYESPHKRGVFIITFRNPTLKSENQRSSHEADYLYAFDDHPSNIIFDSNTGEITEIEGYSDGIRGKIENIIELYKRVKTKKIFGEDYPFHMEFGFQGHNPLIYQIRQFSPYQEANFAVDSLHKRKNIIRGITDEVGEKVTIVLLGDYSHSLKYQGKKLEDTTNIGIKYRKQELEKGIPLRQRKLVTGTGHGRLDDDHGVTKLLYETGGIAVAGTIPGIFPNRDHDKTQIYTGTIFSDGINIVMEGIEEI